MTSRSTLVPVVAAGITVLGMAFAGLGVAPAPVAAQALPDPLPRPINECVSPRADGSVDVVFGWETIGSDGSVTVPVGGAPPLRNQLSGGTAVNGPPTSFSKPVVDGAGNPDHIVWPPFFWNPPDGSQRDGRTQYWPASEAIVNIPASGTARWDLIDRTVQQGSGPAVQRCSQHVFVSTTWDGSPTPPPELDKQAYELQLRQVSNPLEPAVVNAATATCRYLEYATPSANFAPYGEGFTTVETDTLNCWYQNALPYGTDIGGYWVPRGAVYEVTELNVPDGWESAGGLGEFGVDWEDADTYSECGYYPAFGTAAAVLDSDGSPIPEFGRASPKWCLHRVEHRQILETTTTDAVTTTTTATTTTAPPTGILPETGNDARAGNLALAATSALVLGGVLLLVRRRPAS